MAVVEVEEVHWPWLLRMRIRSGTSPRTPVRADAIPLPRGSVSTELDELDALRVHHIAADPDRRIEQDIRLAGVRIAQLADTLAVDDDVGLGPIGRDDRERVGAKLGHIRKLIPIISKDRFDQPTVFIKARAGDVVAHLILELANEA